eukprot:1160013-Pelagomonas_calceolata.AAC.2
MTELMAAAWILLRQLYEQSRNSCQQLGSHHTSSRGKVLMFCSTNRKYLVRQSTTLEKADRQQADRCQVALARCFHAEQAISKGRQGD